MKDRVNQAPAPSRRPPIPFGVVGEFHYRVFARRVLPAAIGEARSRFCRPVRDFPPILMASPKAEALGYFRVVVAAWGYKQATP